jgi:protocatechuate 4,5-dioxygenase alpha subunit
MLPRPEFELGEPGTFVFTVDDARRGRDLNRFAASLRDPERRADFVADESDAMTAAGLDPMTADLVLRRDWTGLMRAGGHLQVLLWIAHAVGQTLWDVGAHNVGCAPEDLVEACPRLVEGLPEELEGASWRP